MRLFNINSISTKIIISLIGTASIFLALTYNMTKDTFSEAFETIIHEKVDVIQDTIAPQIEFDLTNEFIPAIKSIGEKLVEDENILLLKIQSSILKAPIVFRKAGDTKTLNSNYTVTQTLRDPNTKKNIGELTLVYSSTAHDIYMQKFYDLVLYGVFGLVLSIIVISLLLLVALRPLSKLASAMKKFNPSRPKKFQINEFKDDEIGQIAIAANVMIDNLDDYIKQADELTTELSTNEIHLRDAQRIANVGSWEYNVVDDTLKLSTEIYRILGTKPSMHLTFKIFLDYITLDDKTRVKMIIDNAIEKGSKFNIRYKITMQNGKIVHVRTSGKVRKKLNGSVKLTAVTIDITKEIKNKQTIERLAYYDSLTNLPNRTLLKDRANIALAKAKRNDTKFAILFLDLDHFKTINDTLGHSVGDELLIHVSELLSSILRESDSISRIGGDEFVILFSDIQTDDDIINISKKILDTLNVEHQVGTNKLHISTSVGIAIYPKDGQTLEELMTNADTAMYEAKKNGRNNYMIYSDTMSTHINRIIEIENDIRDSLLKKKAFEVYYQVKINANDLKISGAEALLRWNHPTKGLVFPDEFIHVAEANGSILDIGKIVIREVIKDISELNKNSKQRLKFAINLSTKQFSDKNLITYISDLLVKHEVKASQLEFEITETLSMKNIDESLKVMQEIRELGSSIAIDDFGTGYSSLSYLKQFPINTLKIDKDFVLDMTRNSDDKAIVQTIINIAHTLDFKTVAEGVETNEHVASLKEMGCDELQGFLFSKAIPTSEFVNFLRGYNSK